jgi:hypothetical protein
MGLIVGGILLYNSYIRRMTYLSTETEEKTVIVDSRTSAYLFLAIAFIIQFYVPRAETTSVLDPFSVKIVGLLVALCFAYSLWRYSQFLCIADDSTLPRNAIRLESTASKAQDNMGPSLNLLMGGFSVILAFLIANMYYDQNSTPIREEMIAQSLYVGQFMGSALYVNIVSVVIPLLVSLVLVVYYHARQDAANQGDNHVSRSLLGLSAAIALVLFLSIHITRSLQIEQLDSRISQMLFPFMLSPLLASYLLERRERWKEKDTSDSRAQRLKFGKVSMKESVLLYSTILITAIVGDLIVAFSPLYFTLNYVFIGGAGVFDGVLWAPVLTAYLFSIAKALQSLL